MLSSPPNSSSAELKLDPGPPPRRRSKIGCQCTLWTLFTIVCVGGSFLVLKFLYSGFNHLRAPHPNLYQDMKVPYKLNEVVQPLIDSNHTFDIVATVWLRNPAPIQDDHDATDKILEDGGPILVEEAIYTDTVFRGLHLKNKDIKTAVKFQVPTGIFKNLELNNHDLRASFVLIPNAPSLLDHAVNYSSWIPSTVNYPPARSWSTEYSPSLADQITDSYGTFMPMLEFRAAKSRCALPPGPKSTKYSDDEDEDFDDVSTTTSGTSNENKIKFQLTTKGKPVLESHPYIITRSFLRVVDMTRLYNRKAYDKLHRELAMKSCGQTQVASKTDWRECVKLFMSNGNLETRIKLRKTDPHSGVNSTEWAYAPYLTLSRSAWGPLDLVQVPVNREECEKLSSDAVSDKVDVPDEEFVDIKWNIAFSGRTPEKLSIADGVGFAAGSYQEFNMTESEDKKEAAQANVEFYQGLAGYRFRDEAHPRRLFFLNAVGLLICTNEKILEFHYWYSRASTVGITTIGTWMLVLSYLVDGVLELLTDNYKSESGLFGWIIACLWALPYQITTIFMLKAITRADVHWYKWIPIIRFSPATHAERASERLDARTSWLQKTVTFAVLSAIFYLVSRHEFYVIYPHGPNSPTEEGLATFTIKLQSLVVLPAAFLGKSLQLILNFRAKTFAGTYRPCALLFLVGATLIVAASAPHVVGDTKIAPGISLFSFSELVLAAILTLQAAIYPPVLQLEEDENTK